MPALAPIFSRMKQIAATLALILGFGQMAHALTQDDVLQAAFRSGWQTKSGTHMAGLQLSLAPGWKTYWRAPGDAGIPPLFDWSGSDNLAGVRLLWPAPHVFDLNGMRSVGYKGDFVLPIEVTAIDPARPVTLRAAIDLGVCNTVCMPASLRLESVLKGSGAKDPAIQAALDAAPMGPKQAGMRAIGCTVDPISDGLRLTARLSLPALGPDETVVFESGTPGVWVSESATERQGAELVAITEMVPPAGEPFALNRSGVTVTVLADNRAIEIQGCPAP